MLMVRVSVVLAQHDDELAPEHCPQSVFIHDILVQTPRETRL